MERLFLIRVDMERFLGPFTLKQLKEAYGRMEFGLQDEISASLRQWVTFDDMEGIRRHYPELAQMVQTEMLSGWGMSSHTHPPLASSKVKISRKRKRVSLFWPSILLALVLLVSGLVLFRNGQFSELQMLLKDRNLYTAQSLFGEGYNPRFEAHMDRNRDAINAAMKKKKGFNQWIPYVRAVAFSRDGRWEGLTPKRLRGKIEEDLPLDCSMDQWEQVWTNSRSQWSRYLDGTTLPNEHWARLLSFDPQWIRQRSPQSGWLGPGSYHEACMQMALKALQRQSSSTGPWEAKVFMARLRWQLGVIHTETLNEEFQMSGTLWALSCVEESPDEAELKNCLITLNLKTGWKELLERALLKRRIDLMVRAPQGIEASQLPLFQQMLKDFTARAEGSAWSFADDIRFFQEIVQQQGNVNQARSVMQQRLPQVRFD